MGINYELERHLQEANKRGDTSAAEQFSALRTHVNTLLKEHTIFELPRETDHPIPEITVPFEQFLTTLRIDRGLSSSELSARLQADNPGVLGLSHGSVKRYLSGKNYPKPKGMSALQDTLGFTIDDNAQLMSKGKRKRSKAKPPVIPILPENATFGQFVRFLRTIRGHKQSELGTMLGSTSKRSAHTYVSLIENGKVNPGEKIISMLAHALGFTIDTSSDS